MPNFDHFFVSTAERFSNNLRTTLGNADIPGLGDGPDDAGLAALLNRPSDCRLANETPVPALVRSGLWLAAGDLDRSHTISQDDASAEGSLWHGIMHRREGDYSNAAYWMRRVGSHDAFDQLAEQYGGEYRDPYHFNDAVATCRGGEDRGGDESASDRLRQIQWTEWQLLIQKCMSA